MTTEALLESVLIGVWFVFGWVNTSFSFSSGAVIFYLFQIDRDEEDFDYVYFGLLVIITLVGGHYLYQLLPTLIDDKFKDVIAPINFFLGLISKLILDIVLTKDFFYRVFSRKKK